MDYDSDSSVSSLEGKVFQVEGELEPTSAPENALDYLRQVRWEKKRIKKTVIAHNLPFEEHIPWKTTNDLKLFGALVCAQPNQNALPDPKWTARVARVFEHLQEMILDTEMNQSLKDQPLPWILPHINAKDQWKRFCFGPNKTAGSQEKIKTTTADVEEEHMGDEDGSQNESDLPTKKVKIEILEKPTPQHPTAKQLEAVPPYLSVLLKLSETSRIMLLSMHINWLDDSSETHLSRQHYLWLFALLCFVKMPILCPDLSSDMQKLLRRLCRIRASESLKQTSQIFDETQRSVQTNTENENQNDINLNENQKDVHLNENENENHNDINLNENQKDVNLNENENENDINLNDRKDLNINSNENEGDLSTIAFTNLLIVLLTDYFCVRDESFSK